MHPRVHTATIHRSPAFSGSSVWHGLLPAMRDNSLSLDVYKRKPTAHLLGRQGTSSGADVTFPWFWRRYAGTLTYSFAVIAITSVTWKRKARRLRRSLVNVVLLGVGRWTSCLLSPTTRCHDNDHRAVGCVMNLFMRHVWRIRVG